MKISLDLFALCENTDEEFSWPSLSFSFSQNYLKVAKLQTAHF